MAETIFSITYRRLKQMLVYQPPQNPSRFVLHETEREHPHSNSAPLPLKSVPLEHSARELEVLIRHANHLAEVLSEAITVIKGPRRNEETVARLTEQARLLTMRQKELSPVVLAYNSNEDELDKLPVSASIEENQRIIKELYRLPLNKDVVIRRFILPVEPPVKGMLVFMDGLCDKNIINLSILRPLMCLWGSSEQLPQDNKLMDYIVEECLPSNQAVQTIDYRTVSEGINAGDSALFLDGVTTVALIDTKGAEHRSIGRPAVEQSVRGGQSSFTEMFRANTGLIRSYLRTSDLVTEIITIGKRNRLKCAIMYLKSVVNPELVAEIKRRVEGIDSDYIGDSGVLEQFIEDHPNIPFPQALSTERPDRAAANIAEGRVAMILDGNPFAHIVPVTFFTFFHSGEDFSLKTSAGNFMRVLRLIGALMSIVLPAVYLAISYFHQEALPTELILAIAASREKVPFPALFEILLMEISFELIREAGIRVPGVLGSTIGIVGAIILGQAAVTANLVSPIMVVIIAVTGLASFTIPDYRMAFAMRLIRFVFLALAATLGLVGVACGLLIVTVLLCSMKSFGVPYMAPVAPKTIHGFDVVVRGSVFEQERRPDELNTSDLWRQPQVSRRWKQQPPAGRDDQ